MTIVHDNLYKSKNKVINYTFLKKTLKYLLDGNPLF